MAHYPDGLPDELRYAEDEPEEEGPRPVNWQRAVTWVVAAVLVVAVPLALILSL